MLPSAAAQHKSRSNIGIEGRDAAASCTAQEEAGPPSLCIKVIRIPEQQRSCDHSRGRERLGTCTPPIQPSEGLCQLSDDVMIYFEEVMSSLCSGAEVCSAVQCLSRWMDLSTATTSRYKTTLVYPNTSESSQHYHFTDLYIAALLSKKCI